MSQHDMILDNASGATVRSDLNNALQALASTSKGPTAPATPYAGQPWMDDDTPSATMWTLKRYDGADWISLGQLDTVNNLWVPPVGGGTNSLASAGTTDLGSVGQAAITVTGTTTITSFGSSAATGIVKFVTFSGALTLTHNATSLILPTTSNIVTAAGDTAAFLHLGSGNWRCLRYTRASGNPLAGSQIPGTATNDSASAGNIGEYASSNVASGSAVSLVTSTAKNVTNVSLTAGDWDVSGTVRFTGNTSTQVNSLIGSLSATSATVDGTNDRVDTLLPGGTTVFTFGDAAVRLGPTRFSLSSTTTIYLVAQSNFSVSTNSAYGMVWARRVR